MAVPQIQRLTSPEQPVDWIPINALKQPDFVEQLFVWQRRLLSYYGNISVGLSEPLKKECLNANKRLSSAPKRVTARGMADPVSYPSPTAKELRKSPRLREWIKTLNVYLKSFTGAAPAAGHTVTYRAAAVDLRPPTAGRIQRIYGNCGWQVKTQMHGTIRALIFTRSDKVTNMTSNGKRAKTGVTASVKGTAKVAAKAAGDAVKMQLAAKISDGMIAGLKTQMGEHWPKLLDTPYGKQLASVGLPMMLHFLCENFGHVIPQLGMVKPAATLAIQGASQEATKLAIEAAAPFLANVAGLAPGLKIRTLDDGSQVVDIPAEDVKTNEETEQASVA